MDNDGLTNSHPTLSTPGDTSRVHTRVLRASPAQRLFALLSRETSSGRFIPEMDGLRFVAIGMVVLFHLSGYLTAKSSMHYSTPPQADWLGQIALVGFRGVELFFVISGFILALPFAAHHVQGAPAVKLSKYYLRRLTRLEPPYFVTVFLLFLLAVWVQGRATADLRPHLGASLFYVHNLIYGTSSPVIGVAWSLEIEVQFYILVPLLTLLFIIRRPWLRRSTLVVMSLVLIASQTVFLQGARSSLSILGYLQFFLMGFLLADIYLNDWCDSQARSLFWDAAALAGWALLFVLLRYPALTHWLFPFTILLLYCAAFRGVLSNYLFTRPWITTIGGMCYSIYLIHYDLISLVGRFTRDISFGHSYWSYLLIQLALVGTWIFVICGVYFLLLEKPCMRRDWPFRLYAYLQRLSLTGKKPLQPSAAD